MRYNPNDVVEYELVDKGDYEFVVVDAEDCTSRNNNEMISLQLQCDVGREEPITVFDQLVNTPKSLWMLRSFCRSVLPAIDFEAGQLEAANCIGALGTAHLVLGKKNKQDRQYMEVSHYLPRKDNESVKQSAEETPTPDVNSKAESPEEQQRPGNNGIPF